MAEVLKQQSNMPISARVPAGALAIENSVQGAIFYATESMVDISNLAVVTAVVGYKLQMQNNTRITYDDGLADTSFVPEATIVTGECNAKRWNEY